MALITWSDALSVNVQEIDSQHKRLVELVNQLHEAMSQGKGREVLGQVLAGLVDYTQTHFAAEERLMLAHGYPAYPMQKGEHEALTKKVLDLQSQFLAGQGVISIEVMRFLKDWLSNHIQNADKRFGVYLNTQGVK